MGWGALIGAAISTAGAASAASKQSKAARKAREAGEAAQVDPAEVAQLARQTAQDNIRNSLSLEQQYTPENAALRTQTIRNLLAQAGQDPAGDQAISTVRQQLAGEQPDSQLLNDAVRMATEDLALGGQLPQDVRNEVARNSIANAGRVGGGNLGLSRFLTPRDLGVSSMAIRENRLNRAGQLGQQQFGNQVASSELRSRLATLLANLGSNQQNQRLSEAAFGQTLQPPQGGLSPGDIASLFSQNATNAGQAGMNAATLQAQNARNTAQTFGAVGGLVSGVDWGKIFNRTPAPPAGTAAVNYTPYSNAAA